MEQPGEQFEFWPKPIPSRELKEELEKANDELRRAGNYGQRKREDLVSKEEFTKAEGKIPAEVSPFEKNKEWVRKILEDLKEREKREKENKDKEKSWLNEA